jgi:hypothetical protein
MNIRYVKEHWVSYCATLGRDVDCWSLYQNDEPAPACLLIGAVAIVAGQLYRAVDGTILAVGS